MLGDGWHRFFLCDRHAIVATRKALGLSSSKTHQEMWCVGQANRNGSFHCVYVCTYNVRSTTQKKLGAVYTGRYSSLRSLY